MVQTKQAMGPFSSGRHRPFLLLGLILVIMILFYNLWSLRLQKMELTERVNTLNYKLNTITAKKLSLDKRASTLTNRLVELDQIKRSSDQTWEVEKKALLAEKQDLVTQVESINDRMSESKTQFRSLHSSLDKCKKEITILGQNASSAITTVNGLHAKLLAALKEMTSIKKKQNESEAKYVELSAEHNTLQKGYTQLLQEKNQCVGNLTKLKNVVSRTTGSLELEKRQDKITNPTEKPKPSVLATEAGHEKPVVTDTEKIDPVNPVLPVTTEKPKDEQMDQEGESDGKTGGGATNTKIKEGDKQNVVGEGQIKDEKHGTGSVRDVLDRIKTGMAASRNRLIDMVGGQKDTVADSESQKDKNRNIKFEENKNDDSDKGATTASVIKRITQPTSGVTDANEKNHDATERQQTADDNREEGEQNSEQTPAVGEHEQLNANQDPSAKTSDLPPSDDKEDDQDNPDLNQDQNNEEERQPGQQGDEADDVDLNDPEVATQESDEDDDRTR